MTDPHRLKNARAINSREELAAFIQDLAQDFTADPGAWGSLTVGTYLSALAAWLGSADAWSKNVIRFGRPDLWLDPETPSWQLLALALHVARTYE